MLTVAFVVFSGVLKEEVTKQNSILVDKIRERESGDTVDKLERKTLKARVDSLKHLRIIVFTFLVSTAYNLLYSVVTRIL